MRKSMEIALAQQEQLKQRGSYYDNNNMEDRISPERRSYPIPEDSTAGSPFPADRSGAMSPNAESIFSDSLENVMSDFDETYSHSLKRKANRSATAKDYSSDYEVATRSRFKVWLSWWFYVLLG